MEYYSEEQRFRQWWIWLLTLIGPAICLWAVVQQIVLGSPFGNNPAPDYLVLILAIVVGGGLPLFMYIVGLDTKVGDCGLCVRFRPFHRQWRLFAFGDIRKAETCSYSALRDYGGWGVRYGKKGKAYNVSGNKGVMLTLSDGKNVLIGTRDHEALSRAIKGRLQ